MPHDVPKYASIAVMAVMEQGARSSGGVALRGACKCVLGNVVLSDWRAGPRAGKRRLVEAGGEMICKISVENKNK